MRLRMKMTLELFDEVQLDDLLQQALTVWRKTPFRIQGTDEFFSYLTAYGCEVNGEHVRFPEPIIDRVLERIAREKQSRNTAEQIPPSDLSMFTHGQALHICDLETNAVRPALEADLITWCHAVDTLGIEERSHPTFIPTDVPRESVDFHTFATILLNSRKPHRVSVYNARMLPYFIGACKIAMGSLDAIKADPIFATKCWVNSPFMITRENIDIAMDARRMLGIPIMFGHMPVAGAASPVTIAGSLVQNTAESLALCAMRLAIDDCTQGIGSTSAMLDMKDACHRQSGPDLALHIVAGTQMHAHLFGGSPSTNISGVAAPVVSPQSLYKKALSAAFNIANGQRKLGVGCLAFSDIGSPVQLLLDHDMGQYFQHLFREVSADDEHIGLQTILDTIPTGARYLETDHTAQFFREACWQSAFIDHRVPLSWMQNPSDMIHTARQRAHDLFQTAENQCPLSNADQQQIQSLIKDAHACAAQ